MVGWLAAWQKADFDSFRTLATTWPRSSQKRLFLYFLGLGHQMAPGGFQNTHFVHFRILVTEWSLETPRGLILTICVFLQPNVFTEYPEGAF